MHLVNIRTYLHGTTATSSETERAIDEAAEIDCLAATR
jgi:hypothetical protein